MKIVYYLTVFFRWAERVFMPRRHFVKTSIEASRRSVNIVHDTRGDRDAVAKIVKFDNERKGSKFIKRKTK